jgi:hypothetical protein
MMFEWHLLNRGGTFIVDWWLTSLPLGCLMLAALAAVPVACCRYGIVILVVELMGLSAVLPYGFMLFRYTASKGSKGLPIDDGKVILPVEKRFHVRVLIPCYKVCTKYFYTIYNIT